MTTRSFLVGTVIGLALLAIGAGAGFLLGGNHWLSKLTIVSVTPDQIAQAMSDDNFYSTYRENTLDVSGIVAGIAKQGADTVLQLQTSAIFKAYCDIGSASTSLQSGNPVRVLAEGFTAERLTAGVMLTNCVVLQ